MRGIRMAKCSIASIVGTAADYALMIACVELCYVDPVVATAMAMMLGAMITFFLNQRWVFQADRAKTARQMGQYGILVATNLLTSSLLMGAGIHVLGLPYIVARVGTSVANFLVVNYPISRLVIFNTPSRHRRHLLGERKTYDTDLWAT